MGRQQLSSVQQQQQQQVARPKRRATNAHIFRYLQTRNPGRLEETDLKRALEASLEECPDFWPEDSASCSSSEQSNAATTSSNSSSRSSSTSSVVVTSSQRLINVGKRRSKSSMQARRLSHPNQYHQQQNHLHNHSSHSTSSLTAQPNCCPKSTTAVHNKYKPVAKKNIYNEADFFHDGIMEYIEYHLELARATNKKNPPTKH